jgi:hypothetical protein
LETRTVFYSQGSRSFHKIGRPIVPVRPTGTQSSRQMRATFHRFQLDSRARRRLPEVEGHERKVKGLPADLAIDICRAFVSALENGLLLAG